MLVPPGDAPALAAASARRSGAARAARDRRPQALRGEIHDRPRGRCDRSDVPRAGFGVTVRLVLPHGEGLAGYEPALATSESPNKLRDVSAEQTLAHTWSEDFRATPHPQFFLAIGTVIELISGLPLRRFRRDYSAAVKAPKTQHRRPQH